MTDETKATAKATAPPPGAGKTVKCPRCGGPARWNDNPFRPFCSERCKTIDLAAWAEERYTVPGEPLPTDEEET